MTESYSTGPSRSQESTAQVVREQAADVGQGAAQAGGRVAQTAVDQGREVVRETRTQARNLVSEASSELSHQASTQQKRAAEGLRALGSELQSMAGGSERSGMASELVDQAATRAHQAADWLEHRQPGQIVDEVRTFARRRPGAFLAGAVIAGVLVGRLTRNLAGSGGSGTESDVPPVAGQHATPVSTTAVPVREEIDMVSVPPRLGGGMSGEVRP